MIVYTTNILLAPVILLAVGLIWGLNALLLLVAVRLVTARLATPWARRITEAMTPITDPLPEAIARRLSRRGRAGSSWLPWLCLIGGTIVLQQVLVMFVLALG